MDSFESLLDYIVQAAHTDYVYGGWANGAFGTISDHTGRCIYRFFEAFYDEEGKTHLQSKIEEDGLVVAVGIVAYWLHYRETPNRLAAIFGPEHKTISEIFRDYTSDRLSAYKKVCEQRPSSWRSNLERDFYVHHIIPSEKRLIKQSEALFEYITPDDQQLVRDVMKEYILYLQEKRNSYLPSLTKPKKIEHVRVVDIDKIGKHFKREFDKKTYLPSLKMLLEQPESDKNLARMALLIYESKYFLSSDYNTFSKWYKDFCKIVGCKYHKDYAPSALNPISDKFKKNFYFLF